MDLCLWILTLVGGAALVAWQWRVRMKKRPPVLQIQPRYRPFFRHLGLIEVSDFLSLTTVIVSGHPDRNVGRLQLGDGMESFFAFLKIEHQVRWTVRFAHFLVGAGWVSRSLCEARTLQALQREGIACAEWLAAGENGSGQAFLLVREVPDAIELRRYLNSELDREQRRVDLSRLGETLARMHDAGFTHPDLYAKHILINPTDGAIHILDWQRSHRQRRLSWRLRATDLAALNATIAPSLVSAAERLACLRAYLAATSMSLVPGKDARDLERVFLRCVLALTLRKLRLRHVREKRQLPLTMANQGWTSLQGGSLTITPAFAKTWPEQSIEWLSVQQPPGDERSATRRWLSVKGSGLALWVSHRRASWIERVSAWIHGRSAKSRSMRAAELLLRLERHGVPAPEVLATGEQPGRKAGGSFLLTRPIERTVRLSNWLRRTARRPHSATEPRNGLLVQTGELLHRIHQAGCYLANRDAGNAFAVQVLEDGGARVVLGGGDQVSIRRRWRRRLVNHDLRAVGRTLAAAGCSPQELQQFAATYAQLAEPGTLLGPAHNAIATVRSVHADSIPVAPEAVSPPRGTNAMPGHTRALVDRCPAPVHGFWQRLVRGYRRIRACPEWDQFVGPNWSESIMNVPVTDRFHAKQGRSTGRWVLHNVIDEGRSLKVYLKRHYELPWWQGWLATLWPGGNWSPAMQECEHLEWARRQGVPVPAVMAAGERIGPWGRLQSFLAVEELTDMLPLHEAIPLARARLDARVFRRWKRSLVIEMARLTRMLHDRRCFHKDLYLCHFYIARADTATIPQWHGRIYLIDLHRLAHHRWTWRRWQLKDLAQLLYSSEIAGIDARDQLAFWAAYRGTGPRRRADRWLRRWVWLKWQHYRRHNARHKLKAA